MSSLQLRLGLPRDFHALVLCCASIGPPFVFHFGAAHRPFAFRFCDLFRYVCRYGSLRNDGASDFILKLDT